jgi:prolyl 4-hydroxylase
MRAEKNKLMGDRNETGQEKLDFPSLYKFKNPRPVHVLGKERDDYEALCRGEDLLRMSAKRQSKLACRYVHHHPFLRIAPVKEELVYDDPPIWLFYDVITDRQIEILKSLAFPKLKRAIVRSPVTGNYETANYRISQRCAFLQKILLL